MAHGAGRTLEPAVTCNYCRNKGHMKANCICLNNKIHMICKNGSSLLLPKVIKAGLQGLIGQKIKGFSDLGPV